MEKLEKDIFKKKIKNCCLSIDENPGDNHFCIARCSTPCGRKVCNMKDIMVVTLNDFSDICSAFVNFTGTTSALNSKN